MNHLFGVNADYIMRMVITYSVGVEFPLPKALSDELTPLSVEPLKLTHNPAPPSLLPEFPFSAVETAILSCLIV